MTLFITNPKDSPVSGTVKQTVSQTKPVHVFKPVATAEEF